MSPLAVETPSSSNVNVLSYDITAGNACLKWSGMPSVYLVKHLFPYLNADDNMSKENEKGPPLVIQKVDFCIPLKRDDKSV